MKVGWQLKKQKNLPVKLWVLLSHLTKKDFRQKLRRNTIPEETKLWKYINYEQLGVKFRRQHSIGRYIVDFYCPKLKLVIELDGNQHYTEEGLLYDGVREEYMNNLGIKTLRFNNREIRENIEKVVREIIKNLK